MTGTAGTGKSVLLSSWAAARSPGRTAWLSCDPADADPRRFWTGFIEAFQPVAPGFGADGASLLRGPAVRLAGIAASIARDARKLPAGSAIVVDDFHYATVTAGLADLARCWPARTAQLVLSSRFDPPLPLHRLRMTGELCELRDRDLVLSLDESRDLLANLGVRVSPAELALLHQCTEGWAAALQMAALSLRGARDPARAARSLDIHSHPIAESFISEVLDQQPPEVARFMLDTSVLGGPDRACVRGGHRAARRGGRCCTASTPPACSWWHSMRSGPPSATSPWYARHCAPNGVPAAQPKPDKETSAPAACSRPDASSGPLERCVHAMRNRPSS